MKQRDFSVDLFKFIASLMIVGIHTALFWDVNSTLYFFAVNVVFRMAVPYFAICTEYYLTRVMDRENLEISEKRAPELGIKFIYQDVSDKLEKLCEILSEQGITAGEVAYIGDDLNDLECIKHCALSACPCDAHGSVKEAVDYTCCNCGGKGAVREFIDYIVKKRN